MKKLLPLLSVALLAACSPGNDAAEPKAASPAAAASAPVVQAASAPAAASAEAQTASAAEDNWTPPAAASEPKAQAEQLNDLLGQFKDEAAQRTEAYRQKNMQPSYEESIGRKQRRATEIGDEQCARIRSGFARPGQAGCHRANAAGSRTIIETPVAQIPYPRQISQK